MDTNLNFLWFSDVMRYFLSFDFSQLFKNVKPILNAGHTEASGGLDLTIRQCPIPSFTEQKKEQKKVSVLRT